MSLTEEQRTQLRSDIDSSYTGAGNAGRPLVLEAGMQWVEMGLSPKDLDFTNGMWVQAINICMALGVPSQLLGIPGSQTHANFEQAVETFWEDTILPLLDSILDGYNYWLMPLYGDPTLKLFIDRDSISALESQRQILYDRAQKSDFKTITEKRAMVGDPPLTEAEKGDLLVPNTMIPFDLLTAEMDQPAPSPDPNAQPADALPPAKPKSRAPPMPSRLSSLPIPSHIALRRRIIALKSGKEQTQRAAENTVRRLEIGLARSVKDAKNDFIRRLRHILPQP